MTVTRYLVTVEIPDDPSERDVLIPNHGRIRENIQQFIESEYPDAIVDVHWLSRLTQAMDA